MVQLLGSMATMSQLLYLRVPALNALFPDYRASVLDAIGSAFHDHGVWAIADLYPRYVCDYGTPRAPPSSADYSEPFMYTYCRDDDPGCLGPRSQERAAARRGRHRRSTARARTSGRPNRSDPEGPVHDSHPVWRAGTADRAAALESKVHTSQRGDDDGQ